MSMVGMRLGPCCCVTTGWYDLYWPNGQFVTNPFRIVRSSNDPRLAIAETSNNASPPWEVIATAEFDDDPATVASLAVLSSGGAERAWMNYIRPTTGLHSGDSYAVMIINPSSKTIVQTWLSEDLTVPGLFEPRSILPVPQLCSEGIPLPEFSIVNGEIEYSSIDRIALPNSRRHNAKSVNKSVNGTTLTQEISNSGTVSYVKLQQGQPPSNQSIPITYANWSELSSTHAIDPRRFPRAAGVRTLWPVLDFTPVFESGFWNVYNVVWEYRDEIVRGTVGNTPNIHNPTDVLHSVTYNGSHSGGSPYVSSTTQAALPGLLKDKITGNVISSSVAPMVVYGYARTFNDDELLVFSPDSSNPASLWLNGSVVIEDIRDVDLIDTTGQIGGNQYGLLLTQVMVFESRDIFPNDTGDRIVVGIRCRQSGFPNYDYIQLLDSNFVPLWGLKSQFTTGSLPMLQFPNSGSEGYAYIAESQSNRGVLHLVRLDGRFTRSYNQEISARVVGSSGLTNDSYDCVQLSTLDSLTVPLDEALMPASND